MHTRPVWAEIYRSRLTANYLELRRIADAVSAQGKVALLAVVKANAYGHGMKHCAPLLVESGADWIGVTSVEEGGQARVVCPEARILVMSGVWKGEADAAIEHCLTPIVWEAFHLDMLEEAARRRGLPPRSVPVHLEIDTGMSRQGVRSGACLTETLMRFHAGSPLRLDGVATHFSAPEVLDGEDTREQTARFVAAIESVASLGLRPAWIHAGNSALVVRGEPLAPSLEVAAARLGATLMLRPGLSLYGYAPRLSEAPRLPGPEQLPLAKLSPVLAWKSRIASLRNIDIGEYAGYNSTFRANRPTRLALLPMGYADGLNRLLSNRGSALVRGHRAPVAGNISMDQTMLDVTEIPEVAIGDEVVLIGTQGEESIRAYDLADLTGTIPYEVLCNISARVPRLLLD